MIVIKSEKEIAKMRKSGEMLAKVFEVVTENMTVGNNAKNIDDLVRRTIEKMGATPSFLNYRGYGYSTCISKNEEVVHGLPTPDKVFLPGDICSVDIGVYFDGFHADAARTFTFDPIAKEVDHLVKTTKDAFFIGIEKAKPGNRLGEVSFAMQKHIEENNLTVVKDLYSHGIGKELHEDPLIPNYGSPKKGPVLKEGMTFAIEPMVNLGVSDVLTLNDKWTIITRDKKWSAHYENTICIGKDGAEILTLGSQKENNGK